MAALGCCSRGTCPPPTFCSSGGELARLSTSAAQHLCGLPKGLVLRGWQYNTPLRRRRQLICSYSAGTDYLSDPIDVVAKVRTEKVVVLGGSGFVGSAVCKIAVEQGIEVVSLSRSGKPSYTDPWVDQVLWVSGNVFYADWNGLLRGATALISTVGGFGATNEEMEKINGEANIVAVEAASKAVDLWQFLTELQRAWTGIPKFIYISVHDYNLPSFLLGSGYFTGKRKAEAEILSKYPNSGTILRPGFIYGKRRVNGVDIPLDIVGQPLEKFLAAAESFISPLKSIPGSDVLLSSPVSVEDVGGAAVKAVLDDSMFGVFTIEQIKEAAAALAPSVAAY